MALRTPYLRVKQKDTGHELTVNQTMYDFAPDGYEVLDKPAADTGNHPLPTKRKTTVAKAAAEKKAGSGQNKATTPKES